MADTIGPPVADTCRSIDLSASTARGLELARSTVLRLARHARELAKPLVEAMWTDGVHGAVPVHTTRRRPGPGARKIAGAATSGVVIAPERHVLSRTRPSRLAAVDGLFDGYEGYLVADAHAVSTTSTSAARSRRSLAGLTCADIGSRPSRPDPERARQAMAFIGGLFRNERTWATAPPEDRFKARLAESKPIV